MNLFLFIIFLFILSILICKKAHNDNTSDWYHCSNNSFIKLYTLYVILQTTDSKAVCSDFVK